MAIEVGQHLLHYRIAEKIGKGGMGEVYLAEDGKLHRRVALKVLPPETAADPDRRARFEREARAVASLNHPNIVTLHSVEEADGVHFITMELVEGRTLAEMLPRNGFTLSRLLEIAIPLADAVSRAHRAGITHRDLKPDNIMVDTEGRLRVLDFGLAKLRDPSGPEAGTQAATATAVTDEGKILGTVAYMSPEQTEGKEVDPRSDVFSLGTILYEMASGMRPFKGDSNVSTIGAILKDEPASVTELKPSLPNHLGRIIRRCLAKEPDRRYETALGLRNELEDLKAEIDSAGGQDAAGRFTRSTMHRVLFGAVAVIGVAAIFAVNYWRKSEPPATLYTPRPITSAIGLETDVNWSPEAEFVAFGLVISGSYDVMVQPVAGGPATVCAGGPGDQTTPRWSPDGKYLAYISSSEPGSFIYLVPPHGGTPRRLIKTNIPTLEVNKTSASMGDRPWSRDGRTLLVSRVTGSGRMAIYRVDRQTGDAEQFTFPPVGSSDFSPSHSFDGERIVFQRRSHGKAGLLIVPATGGDPEVLLADGFDSTSPAWRPDNRHVVFLSNRGEGAVSLWEIDALTGSMNQLWAETDNLRTFSVSSDNRVAYGLHWHDTFLFEVDVATGKRRQLTSHTRDNFGARFSPDGRTIAYHSTRTGKGSEIWCPHDSESEVVAVDLETGQEQVLFVGPLTEIDVAPDGSAVAFCFGRGHMGMGLAVLKLEPPSEPGGLPRAIGKPEFVVRAEGTWHVHNGGWSADSKSLVYTQDMDYGDIHELVGIRGQV